MVIKLLLGAVYGVCFWLGFEITSRNEGNHGRSSSSGVHHAHNADDSDHSESKAAMLLKEDGAEGNDALRKHLTDWATIDPRSALRWMAQNVPKKGFDDIAVEALRRSAANDLDSALMLAGSIKEPYGYFLRRETIKIVALEDPVKALLQVKDLYVGEEGFEEVAEIWAQTDPVAAIQHIVKEIPSAFGVDTNMIFAIAQKQLTEGDPQALLDWAEEIDLSSDQLEALASAGVSQFVNSESEKALQFAQLGNESDRLDSKAYYVLQQMVNKDTGAAIEFAETLEAGRIRDQAYSAIASGLVESDIDLASSLLDRIEGRRYLDSVTSRMGEVAVESKGDHEAFAWADSLDNPAVRSSALAGVLMKWSQRDMVSLLEQIRAHPESEELLEVLNDVSPVRKEMITRHLRSGSESSR